MQTPFDIASWPRRATFEHFIGFDRPSFNVCVRVDVGAVVAARPRLGASGITVAVHHAVLRAANELEPFRLRIAGDRDVVLHDVVDASTTVLRCDETIVFAHLPYDADFAAFSDLAARRIAAARRGEVDFDAGVEAETDAMVFCTTLPWLDFTSFEHARCRGRDESVPRFAFGRIVAGSQGRPSMAMSVEVHHALVDGLHVGRFVERVQHHLDGFGEAAGAP